MNLGQLTSKAKALVEKRGGTDSLKQDADELKDIARGSGSVGDKAKAAAAAIKDPGADDSPNADATTDAAPAGAPNAGAAEAGPETGGERATRRRAGRRRRR